MSEQKENVMSKIRKALALANDSANDHECETALLMAQRLMVKHGIELSEVESIAEEESKEVVEQNITDRGRTPYWKKALATVIADNFRCYNFNRVGGGKSRIVFLGVKQDVELAKELFDFAVNVLETSVKRYLKQLRKERGELDNPTGIRNDYIIGFIHGLRQKLADQVEELCLTPMLVKDDALVETYNGMRFTSGRSSSVQRGHDSSAYNSGHKEGSSLSKHSRIGG
jgi:hypothetical protein